MKISLTRQVVIRAIHHLENTAMTREQNVELYGLCYGTHGHHYKIQVTVQGSPDEKSGSIVDRDRLDAILLRELVKPYDGTDLNDAFPNTACEALAEEFFLKLEPHFPKGALVRIGIQETRKNYFEFPAPVSGA